MADLVLNYLLLLELLLLLTLIVSACFAILFSHESWRKRGMPQIPAYMRCAPHRNACEVPFIAGYAVCPLSASSKEKPLSRYCYPPPPPVVI